jgi:hypothetical protein
VSARWRAALGLGGVGLAWSGLCLALWHAGHMPAVDTGPLPQADWYAWQAALLPLLLPGLFAAHAGLTARLAGEGSDLWLPLAWVYGGAVALLLVLPESLAFAVGGIEGLRAVAPVSGALLVLGAWAGTARVLRRARPLSFAAAVSRALPGLLLQAALGSIVLR